MLVWPNINTISPPTLIAFPIIFPPSCVGGDWGRGIGIYFSPPSAKYTLTGLQTIYKYTLILYRPRKYKAHIASWNIVEVPFLRDSALALGYLRFSALPGVQCLHPLIALVSAPRTGRVMTSTDLGEKLSKMENIDIIFRASSATNSSKCGCVDKTNEAFIAVQLMEIKALTLLHSSCYCCPACQDHLRNEYFKSTFGFGFMILAIVAIKRWSNALYPHHDCLRWSILRKWCNVDS